MQLFERINVASREELLSAFHELIMWYGPWICDVKHRYQGNVICWFERAIHAGLVWQFYSLSVSFCRVTGHSVQANINIFLEKSPSPETGSLVWPGHRNFQHCSSADINTDRPTFTILVLNVWHVVWRFCNNWFHSEIRKRREYNVSEPSTEMTCSELDFQPN